MLIAVVSPPKGAPGVTVTSIALTLGWPGPALLAECEPRGGELQVGYAHAAAGEGRDLLAVHVASRRGSSMDEAIREHVVAVESPGRRNAAQPGRWVLLGVPEPQQASGIDWTRLGRTLSRFPGLDAIADCGPVGATSAPRQLWAAADLVLLVVRPTAPGMRTAQLGIPRLREDLAELGLGADRLGAVVVGPGRPYPAREVAAALQTARVPLWGELPWDPAAAEVLSSGVPGLSRRVESSKLIGAATKLAAELLDRVEAIRGQTPAGATLTELSGVVVS